MTTPPNAPAREEGPPFCPHCGYDLRADEPMTVGNAHFDVRRGFFWRGQLVHLSQTKKIIIATLMKADGRWVATTVLADRVGYEGDNPGNLIRSQVSRLRSTLREGGVPNLIDSQPGPGSCGYRWSYPATHLAVAA